MFIHLGNNYIIPAEKIIAVLKYEGNISEDLQEIIDIARIERKLINIGKKGKEKTVVMCDDNVYLSPISSMTLFKRAYNYYKEG
jgi:regulator of extracellular matrix RemA (YlzA/DUF370 family)